MSLKVYTIHLRQPVRDAERDIVLVREGFSWGAFLVSVLWALWNRLWLVAIVLMALGLLLPLVAGWVGLGTASGGVLSFALAVLAGLFGNDLKRWTMAGRGYAEVALVAARSPDEAQQRFGERYPHLLAGLSA
ncbi:MAG: DUF2628 domain-containing protein [Defluviicoccus sp.]